MHGLFLRAFSASLGFRWVARPGSCAGGVLCPLGFWATRLGPFSGPGPWALLGFSCPCAARLGPLRAFEGLRPFLTLLVSFRSLSVQPSFRLLCFLLTGFHSMKRKKKKKWPELQVFRAPCELQLAHSAGFLTALRLHSSSACRVRGSCHSGRQNSHTCYELQVSRAPCELESRPFENWKRAADS